MAIRPEDELTNFNAADADYPEGSFKNTGTPTGVDGSELKAIWVNDWAGFFQKLIDLAGITPSGSPDTVPISDYFKSLSNMIGVGSFAVDTGAVNAYVIDVVLDTINSSRDSTLLDGTRYFFKAVNTNTGPATININGLGVINLKRPDGSDLRPNDILTNEFTSVEYDGTNAILESLRPRFSIRDISRNLVIKNNSANPLFQMDVDADEVLLQDTIGNPSREIGVNLTVDITASGANGLDTGAEASSTWYHLWVISNGITTAGLLSLSDSAPTMPAGYTFKALVGAVFNNSGDDFRLLHQEGNNVVSENIEVLTGGTDTTFTSVDLSTAIPTTAKKVHGELSLDISAGGPTAVSGEVASEINGLGKKQIQIGNAPNGNTISSPFSLILSEAQTLYYLTASSATQDMDIDISAWEF